MFQVIDDQDATGFSQIGGSPLARPAAVGGTYTYFAANTGSATYTFTGLPSGIPHHFGLNIDNWTGFGGSIPWQVLDSDNTTVLASGTFSEQSAPSDYHYLGRPWLGLGTTFTPTGDTLTLTFGPDPTSAWMADAAFCQTASNLPPADTIADGNWSSTSTWRGGVVPGANTPVTIAHTVTVDGPVTTGSPGNVAGVVVVDGSLTVLAPLVVTNGISVRAMKSLTVDATAGAAGIEFVGEAFLPRYVSGDLAPGPMFGVALEGAALTLTGTSGSRPYLRTQAGNTANACVSGPYVSYNSGTTVTMSYADLTDLGDATHSSFGPRYLGSGSWSLVKWDAFHATDCVFTRCALYLDISQNTDATSGLVRTRFASSVSIPGYGLNAIYLLMPESGKPLFTIDTCAFDIDVIFSAIGSPTTVTDTVFGSVIYRIGSLLLTGAFERNFLLQGDDTDGMSYVSIPMASSLMKDCYLFSLFTGPNPHLTSYAGGDLVIDGCIVDMPLTYSVIKGMSDSGDTWIADSQYTSLTVRNTLFLPLPLDHPRAPGAMPDEHLNMMFPMPTICEHCTSYATYALPYVSGTRLVEGGEYAVMTPGWLVSVKSNLVYHTLGNLAVVNWAVATNVQDGANASAADLDYNGGYFANPPAGSANGYATTHLTGMPATIGDTSKVGAHDVHGDPQFADPTRSFVTWSRTQRGHNTGTLNGDVAAGLADLVADPTLLSGMMAWVKAGFAPTNPAFHAAHDGGWIGAVEGAAITASSYTLSGPSLSVANQASAAFTVTPVGGPYTGTVTPHANGLAGTFTPSSLSWSGESDAKTFTFTPAAAGSGTVSVTASPAMGTDPTAVAFSASSAAAMLMGM